MKAIFVFLHFQIIVFSNQLIKLNRSDFISYIQHPEALTAANTVNLKELIKDFPYFQTAHLLYTKNLHDQNSIHYNDQLKLAAAYSGDRKVLFNLIHSKNEPVVIEGKQEIPVAEARVIDRPLEDKEFSMDRKSTPVPELEREIIGQAISSSIKIEVDRAEDTFPGEEITAVDEVAEQKIMDMNKYYSFQDWLKIKNTSTPETEKKSIAEEKSARDLIEKFITEEPKISKPKAAFFSPVNLARKSVAEDDTAVSETLARIYETQGHYLKAIKAYERLCLKYPKKNPFFAARIKELKRKLII